MLDAEPSRTDPPKRKRRWFQFSLRTLLIGVTLLAIVCGAAMWHVGEQRRLFRKLDDERAKAESIANQAGIAAHEYERQIEVLKAALRAKNSATQP